MVKRAFIYYNPAPGFKAPETGFQFLRNSSGFITFLTDMKVYSVSPQQGIKHTPRFKAPRMGFNERASFIQSHKNRTRWHRRGVPTLTHAKRVTYHQ